jgi:hypothetical protein
MKIFKDIRLLTFCGGFGALTFAAAYVIGSGITVATGIPIMSAVVNALIVFYLVTIAGLIVRQFGVAIIMFLVYAVLAIPTVLLGPPGILHKLILWLTLALPIEITTLIFRWKWWSYPIGSFISEAVTVPMVLFLMILLGLPGAEKLQKVIMTLALIVPINAAIGSWLGALTYEKKLKNLSMVKSLQASGQEKGS